MAAAASPCPTGKGEWQVEFEYQSGRIVTCKYADQASWLAGARGGVVRGDGGEYSYVYVIDNRPDGGVVNVAVLFKGEGASASVETSYNGTSAGANNWKSTTVTCKTSGPVTAAGYEVTMIRDWVYHITQVVKTHDRYYTGSTVVYSAKVEAASGTSSTYAAAARC